MTSPSSHFTMFRQPAQRYQRAKGLKVKHVLQIAIVTVVLTWVAYELNQSRKPAGSQGQDGSADFRGTVQDSSLERRALKPEGEPRKTEREITTNTEDTTTKSSLQGMGSSYFISSCSISTISYISTCDSVRIC